MAIVVNELCVISHRSDMLPTSPNGAVTNDRSLADWQ